MSAQDLVKFKWAVSGQSIVAKIVSAPVEPPDVTDVALVWGEVSRISDDAVSSIDIEDLVAWRDADPALVTFKFNSDVYVVVPADRIIFRTP